MIIKTDEERIFVNLAMVEAVVAPFGRRDCYCVQAGGQTFEVSRQVGEAILDALQKRDNEFDRIQRIAGEFGRAARAQGRVSEMRRALDTVLTQWSADTTGQANGTLVYQQAKAFLDDKGTPVNSPEQVTA